MKRCFVFLFVFVNVACHTKNSTIKPIRDDFTLEEHKIITTAKEIIKNTYFASFISVDNYGQPRARVMEPFLPDTNFVIWLATNPRSRKVKQLTANPKVTMHYFDKANLGYVSLMGNAYLVNDEAIKATKFKKGWDRFYKNQKEDYLLIKFVPKTLELISIPKAFTGDSITWKPHLVVLR